MSIDVQPGDRPGKLPVATRVIDGIHYPQYISGTGDLTVDAWGSPKVTQAFSLFHGDYVIVTYTGNATVNAVIEWGEEI